MGSDDLEDDFKAALAAIRAEKGGDKHGPDSPILWGQEAPQYKFGDSGADLMMVGFVAYFLLEGVAGIVFAMNGVGRGWPIALQGFGCAAALIWYIRATLRGFRD